MHSDGRKIIFWLGLLITIEQLIGQGTASLTHLVPDAWIPFVKGWCTTLATIGTAVVAALTSPMSPYSFPSGGNQSSPPATGSVSRALVFLAVGLTALVLAMPGAHAQARHEAQHEVAPQSRPEARPQVVAGSIFDRKETNEVSTFLSNLADIDGAVTLSTQIQGLQDPVGLACWQQFSPIQALIKAHPLPLSFKVASDIEAARLAMIAMNQVCANPNCGQMFVDATNAASAIAGNPMNVSFQSLCAKVPVIGTSAVPTSSIKPAPVGTVTTLPAAPAKP